MNFIPAERVPVTLPKSANGRSLTLGIRPEFVQISAPDAPDATLRGKVRLVEPLGARDVVHLEVDEVDVRAIGTPGRRPAIGENVGLVFDRARVHFFDVASGEVVR
jgi:multiple sugar transport system ATP-binding protein